MNVEPTVQMPDASLRALRTRPGFRRSWSHPSRWCSPIAFAWGPDGKLWVVEMGDYPWASTAKASRAGRSRFSKTKGDGKYDKATSFSTTCGSPPASCHGARAFMVTCPGNLLRRGHDGTADRQTKESFTPASAKATSSTASIAWSGVWTTGSTAPTATAAARKITENGQGRDLQRPRSAHPPGEACDLSADRRSMAAAATTGATGSATTTAIRCGTLPWRPLHPPQSALAAPIRASRSR